MTKTEFDNYDHINNEMWLYTDSASGNWIEEGIRHGLENGYGGCSCLAYFQFWAEDVNTVEYKHLLENTTPDGTNHVYEIYDPNYGTTWDVILDYGTAHPTSHQLSTQAYTDQSGLENAGPIDGSNWADNNNYYLQVLQNGNWVNWSSEASWVDHPCGVPPDCLTGTENQLSEWSASHPK